MLPAIAPVHAQKFPGSFAAARAALARSENDRAVKLAQAALASSILSANERAVVRCLLAEALENLAREPEAIQVLSCYEQEPACAALSPATLRQVYLRLGSAYGYTGNLPPAIHYAKQALALAVQADTSGVASCHLLLGRLYRGLGEIGLARLQYRDALAAARFTGSHLLLAQIFLGRGTVSLAEGNLIGAQEDYERAREQLGAEPARLLRGKLEMNRAVLANLQGQAREATAMLERAVSHFTRARNPRLRAAAQTNLAFSLLQLGETARAQQLLKTALSTARSHGLSVAEAAALDTLGEMKLIQGAFGQAEALLRRSSEIARAAHNGFNEAQAHLTLGRCHLLAGQLALGEESFQRGEQISAHISDRRGRLAAKLFLAEARLAAENHEARKPPSPSASRLLADVRAEVQELNHLPLAGHWRELSGRLALAQGNYAEAMTWLHQAASIFDLIGHRYRAGVAHYHLGNAQARAGETKRAQRSFEQAEEIFQALGARPMRKKAATALAAFATPPQKLSIEPPEMSAAIATALFRLWEAGHSRELLLRELTLILREDFGVSPAIVYEHKADRLVSLCAQGCRERQAAILGKKLAQRRSRTTSGEEISRPEPDLYELTMSGGPKLALYLGSQSAALSPPLIAILLKQITAQLEIIRFRPAAEHLLPTAASIAADDLTLPDLIYQSQVMRRIVEQVHALRDSQITILITGEPGTGKELIARAIHALSPRASGPFVPFNCAAMPADLVESQLFGHRRGAFTGAHTDHPGLIRAAAEGTLFLDEIGELASAAQPKLLRFLERGEIQPVGEAAPRIVNVRVLAATNRRLPELIAEGKFRADLYHRIHVLELPLPPLRERREEIPLLAEHFLQRHCQREHKTSLRLSAEVTDRLTSYDWPGNVRQLSNEIERLVALTPGGSVITANNLSPHIIQPQAPAEAAPRATLEEARTELERRMLLDALARHQGSKKHTARELGVSRPTLDQMIARHHVDWPKAGNR
jgi:hydrogenase-4 transcriptional activator